MDWIHCNNCFVQPGDIDSTKFFITNCGHIYCNECLEQNKSNECRICHIRYTTIPLKANMSSEVEMYFRDPVANIKKQVKVLEFQQTHRARLVSRNRERIINYKAIKKDNFKLRDELKQCKEENASLLNENKNLKTNLFELKRKYELSVKAQPRSITKSPQFNAYSQSTPKNISTPPCRSNLRNFYRSDDLDEINFNPNPKRIPDSNFFLMREQSIPDKNQKGYKTPETRRFPGSYRNNKIFTPDSNSPSTPESVVRDYSETDPLLRKDKYSEIRNFQSPSPATRFHRLSLSRSTPVKENSPSNKYLKYFK